MKRHCAGCTVLQHGTVKATFVPTEGPRIETWLCVPCRRRIQARDQELQRLIEMRLLMWRRCA